jgi:uncharacterized cupin superfamily protein
MLALHAKPRTLHVLPAIRDTPGYRVVRGNPIASIRFEIGEANSMIRTGYWACTTGAFECTEAGDELQTLLQGRLKVIESDGTEHEFKAGDSFFTRKGEVVIWDVLEDIEKIFFTYIDDGQDNR